VHLVVFRGVEAHEVVAPREVVGLQIGQAEAGGVRSAGGQRQLPALVEDPVVGDEGRGDVDVQARASLRGRQVHLVAVLGIDGHRLHVAGLAAAVQ
jgi:hypothetical protein